MEGRIVPPSLGLQEIRILNLRNRNYVRLQGEGELRLQMGLRLLIIWLYYREITLDGPRGPCATTGDLTVEERKQRRVKESCGHRRKAQRCKIAGFEVGKRGPRTQEWGFWQLKKARKWIFPYTLHGKGKLCQYLGRGPVRPVWDFWPPDL